MRRALVFTVAAAAGVALILGYAAFSLVETERRARAAAEAGGRALLVAVSAGIEKSLAASRAVERLLADRFLELGRDLDRELAAAPGREEVVLRRFTTRHRVKSALLLDTTFAIVARHELAGSAPAAVPSPVDRAGLPPMVATDLIRKIREAGLADRDHVVVFGDNLWGTRVDFLLGLRLPETGGFLLIRHDAEELRTFQREAGLSQVLATASRSEAIAWLGIGSREDGAVLLVHGDVEPARWSTVPDVIEVRIDADWPGFPPAVLRVGLRDEPVRAVIERGRESIFLFTAVLLLVGAVGAATIALVVRARRRREATLERRIAEQEKTASMGRLAAGVAHEIRGPLNAIGMAVQRLERASRDRAPDAGLLEQLIPGVRREVGRLDRTVAEFLELGRPRPLELRNVDLTALIREAVRDEFPDAAVEAPGADPNVRVDPDAVLKAVANLLRNAGQACPDGPVAVAWRRRRGRIEIEVRDGGPGVPREDRERIFEYFATNRSGGTGLGLGIVRSVAARHGGRVEVGDAPEGGARFVLRLPDER
ncbi:MAG: ATP-binding protein [Planctomycetota bacterium]